MNDSNHTILFIDDDPEDVELMREALESIDPATHVIETANGLEGLAKLKGMRHTEEGLPCLIVLDINMPRMNGRETFQSIKEDSNLSSIPLVVLSTSDNNNDKMFFNRKDVEYLSKPVDPGEFKEIAARMLHICKH